MQTSNTEEMVTISRAEYERLQQENAQLEAKSAKLEETHARLEAKFAALEQEQAQVITSLTLQNEWLLEQLKLSKKKLFGRSSEQAEQMVMEQLSLTYNELEAYAFGTKAATEKQITVKAHERKRQPLAQKEPPKPVTQASKKHVHFSNHIGITSHLLTPR